MFGAPARNHGDLDWECHRLQQAQPGRQVIALAGDGGFSMLLGDVLTTYKRICR